MRSAPALTVLIGASLLLAAAARGNDGYIEFGGSPKLLRGHPSIRMERELVRMTVGQNVVTTDCRFVFHNEGPACTVRIGFPDQAEGAGDPDEEGIKNPPRGSFLSFRSWVDGQPYRTQVVRASPGKFWHAKTVRFPAHSRRVIRDLYTCRVGVQATRAGTYRCGASYILHTGASWHGKIGRSELRVTFHRRRMRSPLQGLDAGRVDESFIDSGRWARKYRRVYYVGPGRPGVKGATLTWIRTNWRPREADDLALYFDNGPDEHSMIRQRG